MSLSELAAAIAQLERRQETYRLEYYQPYPKQLEFHHAPGLQTGQLANQRALMAGNQIGKTYCAAMETAMHLTGRYPDWWKGHRFLRPVEILVGSNTNETARDICQRELFGDPTDERRLGTGTIPIDCIGKVTRNAGVPNAIDSAIVKHVSGGNSKVHIRAYEQGFKKFMGIRFDVGWCDEEPPIEIWSQFLRATFARPHAILYLTFTPEEGMTQVVSQFTNDLKPGQALITATWDDAKHMTEEVKQQRLAALPAHEREMRSKGVPLMGAGLVFPVSDEQIIVEPFEIPRHWRRIVGIDFGWDHPFGAAQLAWDLDSDVVYVISDYREAKAIPAIHAAAISKWGDWIPVAWPHDGLNAEKRTGSALIQAYRDEKINVLPWKATNPPGPGQKEGEGGNSVEAPLMDMLSRMETGRWKVFSTCKHSLEEKRMYHRDNNGKLVKLADDVISASCYAYMMRRHARTISVRAPQHRILVGARNW